VIPQLKHPDGSQRSRIPHKDETVDLAPRVAAATTDDSALDPATKATPQPWRHPHLVCPCCSSGQVSRAARHSQWDYLLSIIYIYPFRCESCAHKFRVFEWGVRYRRQRRD